MKALVLGGGSIKGAWQCGAIRAVLESGYEPDIITGISVGTANGVFLASKSGENYDPTKPINWKKIGEELENLWLRSINYPDDVAVRRSFLKLAWSILRKKFNGITDSQPLRDLIYAQADINNIRKSPVEIYVGTVNLNGGKIYYADKTHSEFLEYAIGSAAIPLTMPPARIGHKVLVDGGLVDSAPLATAFSKGATEIVCIGNHPEDVGATDTNAGDILQLAERVIEIMLNNNMNNDVNQARLINEVCPADGSEKPDGIFKGKKRIPLTIIRPETSINVSLTNFNKDDIRAMIQDGYWRAKEIMEA